MSVWIFLREQWRLLLFFVIGVLLALLVVVLDALYQHVYLPARDLGYALVLAVTFLLGYMVVEYLIRRPFYNELQARLAVDGELVEASTFSKSSTYEQGLFLELLHTYHQRFMVELSKVEERYKFYELFVTRFAHQMKTPITVLQLLESEMYQHLDSIGVHAADGVHASDTTSDHLDLQTCKETLKSMEIERERLLHSMNMMLHTARLTSFEFDAHMETIECIGFLRQSINEHKTQWIRLQIYPKIEVDCSQVPIQTDRKWFHFICDQIIRNALQYGNKATSFTLRIEKTDEQVDIHFIDEGIGIPRRDLNHVWEPFYTGANGRTHSRATGLGLYLVKEVADQLGHRVSIQSTEGKGTTVMLTIFQPGFYEVAQNLVCDGHLKSARP